MARPRRPPRRRARANPTPQLCAGDLFHEVGPDWENAVSFAAAGALEEAGFLPGDEDAERALASPFAAPSLATVLYRCGTPACLLAADAAREHFRYEVRRNALIELASYTGPRTRMQQWFSGWWRAALRTGSYDTLARLATIVARAIPRAAAGMLDGVQEGGWLPSNLHTNAAFNLRYGAEAGDINETVPAVRWLFNLGLAPRAVQQVARNIQRIAPDAPEIVP